MKNIHDDTQAPKLKFDYGKKSIDPNSIKYFESIFGNYTNVQIENSKPFCSSFTLKHYREKLKNSQFILIRKGLLLNISYLKNIEKVGGVNWVELKTGEKFKMSRRCSRIISNLD